MRIYLDYNATTPPLPEAIDAMTAALHDDFGNASSVHAFGQRAKAIVDDARGAVAALIDADPSEIVFTGSGTEADNLALRGGAEALAPSGRRHIVTTGIEHEAVLNTVRALEKQGWRLTVLGAGNDGHCRPLTRCGAVITRETALVSVMHANNEIGTIQPIASLAAIAREHGAVFHTDAVQSAGKIPVSVEALGADLLRCPPTSSAVRRASARYGSGAASAWSRPLTGGRQERTAAPARRTCRRSPGWARPRGSPRMLPGRRPRSLAALRDRLESGILASVPGTAVNGDRDRRVPNTTNISFDGVEAESLLIALDLEGVAVSTGSACSSGSLEPSHVLKAMGLPNARTRNSLRFSLGARTTEPRWTR